MIELLPWILKSYLRKTVQPTKTETFSQTSGSVPAFTNWRNQQVQGMIERAAVKPIVRTVSKDITGGRFNVPKAPVGITGGPPMTTTKTTVTYATGKPRTVYK